MATNMSRRVFLKCAGAAALAVTASGIFAGCSPSGGGSKDTVYGVGESTQINGVNVKLLGYQQYWVSEMAGNYSGKTMIQACFAIDNQSGKSIQMGNTSQDYLAKVWYAVYNNRFDTLAKGDFVTATKNGQLGNAAISYKMDETGTTSYGVIGTLEDKKTGCIKVFIALPENWDQIGIQYTPYFAPNETRSFVLNRANKLN